jgi:hypothetical protein
VFASGSNDHHIATNVLKERRDNHEQFLQALSNLNTKNPEAIPLPQHAHHDMCPSNTTPWRITNRTESKSP